MPFFQVASIISEVMLVYVDKLRSNEISLEKKLERERKRTQRLVTSYQLCMPSSARPKLNTERFKDSFFNRSNFKYNLFI